MKAAEVRSERSNARRIVYVLLVVEALLLIFALLAPHIGHLMADVGSLAVLLLAANSVLLIRAVARLRRKPSCCR